MASVRCAMSTNGALNWFRGADMPSSNELLYHRGEPCFYAFDLLWLDGEDLRELPRALPRLIPRRPSPCYISITSRGAAKTCSASPASVIWSESLPSGSAART